MTNYANRNIKRELTTQHGTCYESLGNFTHCELR